MTSRAGAGRDLPEDLDARKQDARRAVRDALRALGAEGLGAASASICRRLLEIPAVGAGGRQLWYASLPLEVDVLDAANAAVAAGATCCLPRVTPADRLEAVMVDDLSPSTLSIDALGVPTPRGARTVEPSALDVIVVPGRAFDAGGRRLGRGGGHYDRLLSARQPGSLAIGVAAECQMLEAVPTGPLDRSVDVVVTDARTIYTQARDLADNAEGDSSA